jgi:hypothetical protein
MVSSVGVHYACSCGSRAALLLLLLLLLLVVVTVVPCRVGMCWDGQAVLIHTPGLLVGVCCIIPTLLKILRPLVNVAATVLG